MTKQTLVIAEKPSVANAYAKVLGAKNRNDGYISGNGYIISWCVGHLVSMSYPKKYDDKYKYWNLKDLPIIPDEYLYEVSKYTKKQFNVLKKLLNDKNTYVVVNGCDAGREGELIFRLVYDMAKSKKEIKRLWISSMEESAIKKGFENLKSSKDYENLYNSALARMKADWLIGMNMSRFYSITHKDKFSVGRVQTPTLSMIAARDFEIENFKKEKYYTLDIITNDFTLSSNRIDDVSLAKKLKGLIPEKVEISEIIEKEKITKPDVLFDLTTLQRECNKYFSYSAKQTLDYAQSIYEKKLITYPRTDSRYLSDDMKETTSKLLDGIKIDNENFGRIFNSSKVTDHSAIIPTILSFDFDIESLPNSERKVFELIVDKLYAAVSSNLVENTTKIIVKVKDYEFTINGKVVINKGFTEYLSRYKEDKKDVILPKLSKGDKVDVKEIKIKEKYTTAPKYYNENTLLKAMEISGNENIEKGIEVERKGLGTPATRAGIIENLISRKLIKRDKKNLLITDKGKKLISVVSNFLKTPKWVADFEMKLYDISNGKFTEKQFLDEIIGEIKKMVA